MAVSLQLSLFSGFARPLTITHLPYNNSVLGKNVYFSPIFLIIIKKQSVGTVYFLTFADE